VTTPPEDRPAFMLGYRSRDPHLNLNLNLNLSLNLSLKDHAP
jgi:hypothetical protein